MTKAPMMVPPIVPRPPDIEVPPSTAAAMAFSSKLSPVAGCEAISSEEMIEADDRRAEAGEHVDEHLDPIDADAGDARRALIAADREDVPAERREAGDDRRQPAPATIRIQIETGRPRMRPAPRKPKPVLPSSGLPTRLGKVLAVRRAAAPAPRAT